MIVVDANAIIYALLPGQFTESARDWLNGRGGERLCGSCAIGDS